MKVKRSFNPCQRLALAAGLLVLGCPALAQTELEPGLWEYSFDIKSKSGQIEAAMAQAKKMLESLPPEQRAMIEQQMGASGFNLDLESYTAQVCITPEQARQQEFPQPSGDCSQEVVERSGDVYKVEFRCEGDPPTTGEGEIRLLSDKEYRGTVTVNTSVNGQPESITANQSGAWKAADCGSVKPLPN